MTMVSATPFTRRDYMRLPEGFPAQLVEGELIRHPPAELPHAVITSRLLFRFGATVGQDRILPGPFDLFIDEENVYQPDLLVFDRELRVGPEDREVEKPALVAEVLSPSTARIDKEIKTRRYLAWGVREVWLVDPEAGTVEIRGPDGPRMPEPDGVARSAAVDGLAVDLTLLFRV